MRSIAADGVAYSLCVFGTRCIVQKRMSRKYRVGKHSGCLKETTCWMEMHIGAIWRMRLNDRCAVAMRSCVKLLWSLVAIIASSKSNYFDSVIMLK